MKIIKRVKLEIVTFQYDPQHFDKEYEDFCNGIYYRKGPAEFKLDPTARLIEGSELREVDVKVTYYG